MHVIISPHDLTYAVFALLEGGNVQKEQKVETTPESLLENTLAYLEREGVAIESVEGMVVVTGPGSFTALRAGLSVVNTFAFVHEIPLVAVPNPEEKILGALMEEVDLSKTQTFVTPHYGREPNITKPKN